MNSICREVEGRWCTECCEGRNCDNLNLLPDGSWGCISHASKPEFCDATDCLEDYNITKIEAIKTLKSTPRGEFFASILFNTNK